MVTFFETWFFCELLVDNFPLSIEFIKFISLSFRMMLSNFS